MKYITHDSYAEICDIQWDTGKPIPEQDSVVHVPTDHIVEFFKRIQNIDAQYVVVSSNSDYCIEYQQSHPVAVDMQKWLQFIDCSNIGYNSLHVPTRCRPESCLFGDQYSVKMYSWTKDTFNTIPNNVVKWFGTNINISDERIVRIPFGVAKESIPFLQQKAKTQFGIYCNWQNNTIERNSIKQYFRNVDSAIVEDRVPIQDFISSIQKYPFIISPPGNGLDCYRTLESLYCGSVPITTNQLWTTCYFGLPVMMTESYMYGGIESRLKEIWNNHWPHFDFSLDNTRADWYYWEQKIRNSSKEK